MPIETPKYKVLKKEKNYELRQYNSYITASVLINERDYDKATNQGFGYLADYIFGNNTKKVNISMTAPVLLETQFESEKIAMTTPVITSKNKNTYKISFVMPSKYGMKTLPQPNNKSVTISEIQSFKAVAITFAGTVNKKIISTKTNELKKWAIDQKLKSTNIIQVAQYNPPWTLWFLRRNEVIMRLF